MSVPVRVSESVKVNPAQAKQVTDVLTALLVRASQTSKGTADDPVLVVVDMSGVERAIGEVASSLRELVLPPQQQQFSFTGGGFVQVYAGDRADEDLRFNPATVVDSEGTPVDPQPDLTYTHSSDNPELVQVIDNGNGTVKFHYGSPQKLENGSYAIATITSESNAIDVGNGNVIKDINVESIQLVPGIAAGFSDSGFAFNE